MNLNSICRSYRLRSIMGWGTTKSYTVSTIPISLMCLLLLIWNFLPFSFYSTGVVSGVSIHLIAYFLLRTCIWVFISFIFIVTIRKLFLRNTCRLVFLVIRCCEWILFEPAKIDIFFLLWSAKIDMFFAYAQNNDQLETPAYYHKETWQGGGGEEPKG